jgi:uncharacterized membrane protein YphA (DoxX/SURF4 family)
MAKKACSLPSPLIILVSRIYVALPVVYIGLGNIMENDRIAVMINQVRQPVIPLCFVLE